MSNVTSRDEELGETYFKTGTLHLYCFFSGVCEGEVFKMNT